MSPDRVPPDKATARWLTALAVSVALHAVAVSTLSGNGRPAAVLPSGKLTVALRRVEPPGDGKLPGGAVAAPVASPSPPGAAPVPKPPVEQKPLPAPTKPAAKPPVVSKPKPAKVQPAPARTEAASVSKTPEVSSAPAEGQTGASTSALVAGGSVGSGGGSGGGSGSGTGRGRGESGGVVDVADLKVLRRVKPDYPAIARRRREEGTVTLLLTLEGDGVTAVTVEKTSGFSALDEAAVAAVRRWRFENAGRTLARVPVTFKLGK